MHCYRFLGSAQDAEDAVQETLLAAWRGLGGFEGRASVRTWLYQVATSRCLRALRSAGRRPPESWPDLALPEPTRAGEVAWLEPYPDVLLEGLADLAPGPQARYEAREAISRAFDGSDVHGVVCLLTRDARVRMPPLPMQYQGRELAAGFFGWAFRGGRFRLIPTRANGQPAFGLYLRDPHAAIARADGLLVLTLAGHQISAITRFEPGILPRIGLPRILPD